MGLKVGLRSMWFQTLVVGCCRELLKSGASNRMRCYLHRRTPLGTKYTLDGAETSQVTCGKLLRFPAIALLTCSASYHGLVLLEGGRL